MAANKQLVCDELSMQLFRHILPQAARILARSLLPFFIYPNRFAINTALLPPNANEFDITTLRFGADRAMLGT